LSTKIESLGFTIRELLRFVFGFKINNNKAPIDRARNVVSTHKKVADLRQGLY
jgi:hypothetical protein